MAEKLPPIGFANTTVDSRPVTIARLSVNDDPERRYAANPETDWSLVGRAGDADPDQKRAALNELLIRYLPPMRAHLIHQRRIDRGLVDDLLQGFISDKVLTQGLVARADRERGRFRNLLLTALDRYVWSYLRSRGHRDRQQAASLDTTDAGFTMVDTTDVFDEAWALEVWSAALKQMKARCESTNRMDLWGIFDSRALRPAIEDRPALSYAELVDKYHFQSPVQAANAFGTAKQMFERILRSVVGEYVESEEEAVIEMRDLRRILARSTGTLATIDRDVFAS